MQVPMVALILSAINFLGSQRPINTDHLPNDPSLQDAFENIAATATLDSDDLDLAGDIESFGEDMDIDTTIALDLFGIPPLKVTRPGFITDDGVHGCSYSYKMDTDPLPLALRPSRYVLYRFPDTNSRTSVHSKYHIETEFRCLPSIHAINPQGEIIRTFGDTKQIGENNFTVEWMARLAKDQRYISAHKDFFALEEKALAYTIVWDIPSTSGCSLLIKEMHHVYYSAAPLVCPIGGELKLLSTT